MKCVLLSAVSLLAFSLLLFADPIVPTLPAIVPGVTLPSPTPMRDRSLEKLIAAECSRNGLLTRDHLDIFVCFYAAPNPQGILDPRCDIFLPSRDSRATLYNPIAFPAISPLAEPLHIVRSFNTDPGETWDGRNYDYVHFKGDNPKYKEEMDPIDSRALYEQYVRNK